MNIIHLCDEIGWRGGESQLTLLASQRNPSVSHRIVVISGSEVHKRDSSGITIPVAGMGLRHPKTALIVRSLAKNLPNSLIHVHGSAAGATAYLATWGTKIPVVITRRTNFRINSVWKYRKAKRIVCVSQNIRSVVLLRDLDPRRVVVIHDYADSEALANAVPNRMGIPPDDVMVLCNAALVPDKDHTTLFQAWRNVEDASNNSWLIIAGTGPCEPELKKLADMIDLKRVIWAGFVVDIRALIVAADIAVLSSTKEGLGSAICEAQWAGVPAVVTSTGGLVETVKDGITGLISPVGDAENIAENLITLITNSAKRKIMGSAATARAITMFSPDVAFQEYLDIYRHALGDS